MLPNAHLLAKIGADTAENERNFAEILPKIGNYPPARRRPRAPRLLRARRAGGDEAGRAVPAARRLPTRRVVANFWQNFGKMLLVFGCIGTDFCKKIRVLQHLSKSTRYQVDSFEIWLNFAIFETFAIFLLNFEFKFHENC